MPMPPKDPAALAHGVDCNDLSVDVREKSLSPDGIQADQKWFRPIRNACQNSTVRTKAAFELLRVGEAFPGRSERIQKRTFLLVLFVHAVLVRCFCLDL
jgi:hypothetical protein